MALVFRPCSHGSHRCLGSSSLSSPHARPTEAAEVAVAVAAAVVAVVVAAAEVAVVVAVAAPAYLPASTVFR